MGTWNAAIKGNDTTMDIYLSFFERYNAGENQEGISLSILDDFQAELHDDDKNNTILGLALAQWETKCLSPDIYQQVVSLVHSGNDLDLWENLGADEKTLRKRKKALEKFLEKISTERPKPKRRVKAKVEFSENVLVKTIAPDHKKEFDLGESFINQDYKDTSGGITWYGSGGSGVLHYCAQNALIKAEWVDSNNLEITHEKNIKFSMKRETVYFDGDEVKVRYIANT